MGKKRKSFGFPKPISDGKKKKVWGAKNVLHSPFSLAFPPALAGSADAVIDVLKAAFPEPPMLRPPMSRARAKDVDDSEDLSKSSNHSEIEGVSDDNGDGETPVALGLGEHQGIQPRADDKETAKTSVSTKRPAGILVGMNEVTKGLEKGNVVLVVAARDSSPPILISHLPALCYMQSAALVSASGNGDDIAAALGVKKLLAFGILRPEKVEEGALRLRTQTLMETLRPHATPLDFPWLAVAKGDRQVPPELPEPHLAPPSKLL